MHSKHVDRSLASQIITYIFVFMFLIFFVSIVTTFYMFSHIMQDNARESISRLASGTIALIDGRLDKVQTIAHNALELQMLKLISNSDFELYLHDLVMENPEISSINVSYNPLQPNIPDSKTIYHQHNNVEIVPYNTTDYQYMDWYQIPFLTEKSYWTEPWFDAQGVNKYIVSYCLPIFREGKVIGIMRFDTDLSYLQNIVTPLKLKKGGYAFLISSIGTIITHPADSLIMDESIYSLAENYHDEALRKLGKSMVAGDVNFIQVKSKSIFQNSWVYYSPLLINNWSLGLVIGNGDVLRDLNLILLIQVVISILVFLAISVIVYSRTLSVSKPLRKFADIAERIGKGDFNSQLPAMSKTQEIERLAQSFAAMQNSLKEYIRNLEISNLERNRILSEVRFAAEIQKNLIPAKAIHPYGIPSLRVFGVFEPASEIGGDLYDYFMIDDRNFCFAIADVVGKGIVAAMTMTIVSTFLRSVASYHHSSSSILSELNNFLCKNSIEANFVTVLLGVINLETGSLEFSNAGHVPMFIRKMDRSYKKYSETHSTAVGVFENLPIGNETVQLDLGDEIILFTDGITEAMNEKEDFLGIAGVEAIVKKLGLPNPQTSANTILESVHSFSQSYSVKDDITILAIDYKHPKGIK